MWVAGVEGAVVFRQPGPRGRILDGGVQPWREISVHRNNHRRLVVPWHEHQGLKEILKL